MMVTGRPYTENEIRRAVALRAQGLAWSVVGERLGRSAAALQITVGNYQKGTWAPARMRARSADIDRRIEALVASGRTTIREVANAVGLSEPAASARLGRLGLDHEMRLELAASSRRGIAA